MAKKKNNRLQGGQTYEAFCYNEEIQVFKFTFNGDRQELARVLHEKFSLKKKREIALNCGNLYMDDERHSGNFWYCDLAVLQEGKPNCKFGRAYHQCREEYGGEDFIIIDPV